MMGWHFYRGAWLSRRRTPDLSRPWPERQAELRAALDTAEDVELFAAEMGVGRLVAHNFHPSQNYY